MYYKNIPVIPGNFLSKIWIARFTRTTNILLLKYPCLFPDTVQLLLDRPSGTYLQPSTIKSDTIILDPSDFAVIPVIAHRSKTESSRHLHKRLFYHERLLSISSPHWLQQASDV